MARLYEWGIGVPKDIGRARSLYTEGCDGDMTWACRDLGILFDEGKVVVPTGAPRPAELFRRACDGGNNDACMRLGRLQAIGHGMVKDLAGAAALYRHACDGDSALACTLLGYLYQTGGGVAADPLQAARLYREACDRGDDVGCRYMEANDRTQHAAELERDCGKKNPTSCTRLAFMNASIAKESTASSSSGPRARVAIETTPPSATPVVASHPPVVISPRGRSAWPLVLAGGGGLLAATGVWLLERNENTRPPIGCADAGHCPYTDSNRGLGWGLLAVGSQALIGGIIWRFSERPSDSRPVSLAIGPNRLGVTGNF